MSQTDPIADFLTIIRNGQRAHMEYVDAPRTKIKEEIARLLKDEGYISDYEVFPVRSMGRTIKRKKIRIHLRYLDDERREPMIEGIERISKPGRRVYVPADSIPSVKSGVGVAILTTSKGILSDRSARYNRMGGEVICNVW